MIGVYLIGTLLVLSAQDLAAEPVAAVSFRKETYFSLDHLAGIVGGRVELTESGRRLTLTRNEQRWEFLNGGESWRLPSGVEKALSRPLLVLGGHAYFPLAECVGGLGLRLVDGGQAFEVGDRRVTLAPKPIDSPYAGHVVGDLKVIHEAVRVEKPLPALRSLHRGDETDLRPGRRLLVRRTMTVDGTAYGVVSDTETGLESWLVRKDDLRGRVVPDSIAGTTWERYARWFRAESRKENSLRHGPREGVGKRVAITIDLCWSLRAYEERLFATLKEVAYSRTTPIHATLFVSGRWLEQHPKEMHALLELGRYPRIRLTWGLHSWAHPKSGAFMNSFSPDRFREDTLRLERGLLEWGIVPTVFYRFPGLIHDESRLREVLDLDLFPIDCDAWLALVRQADRPPFYHQVRNGSILLVHGNGNEPAGIPLLQRWLQSHGDWDLAPLSAFFPADH